MFRSILRNDLPGLDDLSILLAYYGGCVVVFLAADRLGKAVFGLPGDERAILAMGSVYGNTVMLGLPIVYAVYGEQGLIPLILIIGFHNVVLIPLTTTFVEIHRGRGGNWKGIAWRAFRALLAQPVFIAFVFGLAFVLIGLPLPKPVDRVAELLGGAAAPTALFALGASLAAYRITGNLPETLTMVAVKLAVLPVVVWIFAAVVFRLDPVWTAVATITAGLPCGVNVFILSNSYGIYVGRATSATLISTGLAIFSVAVVLRAVAAG
jgi:predicted permease